MNLMAEKELAVCDECGSLFFKGSSQMMGLCPECAHVLYGYPNCDHHFQDGRCVNCYWDGSKSVSKLSFAEMVDFLKLKRFGSLVDDEMNQQVFIMDLSFNPEITDELMVIYFDLNQEIFCITHES